MGKTKQKTEPPGWALMISAELTYRPKANAFSMCKNCDHALYAHQEGYSSRACTDFKNVDSQEEDRAYEGWRKRVITNANIIAAFPAVQELVDAATELKDHANRVHCGRYEYEGAKVCKPYAKVVSALKPFQASTGGE